LGAPDFVAEWPAYVTRGPGRGCAGCRHYRLDLQNAARRRVRAGIRPGKAFDALCRRTAGYPHGALRLALRLALAPMLRRSAYGKEGGFERVWIAGRPAGAAPGREGGLERT
jgi:hypothetical protein